MNWSGFAKFLTGFTLAIALLFFAGVNITRYLITRLTAPPPKPIFPNDSPAAVNSAAPTPSASPTASAAPSPTPSSDAASSPASSPSPSPSPTDEEGYEARVTEPIGLILRSEPSQESERLGGVEFEQDLIVLETSPDGEWLRVRLPNNDTEGWVRAGNVERTDSR
jgi:cytoskeletal protein RodZ